MQKIKIEITEEDARKFRIFMENYDTFTLLLSYGIFDIKNGMAEISFNNKGKVGSIKTQQFVFREKYNGYPLSKELDKIS